MNRTKLLCSIFLMAASLLAGGCNQHTPEPPKWTLTEFYQHYDLFLKAHLERGCDLKYPHFFEEGHYTDLLKLTTYLKHFDPILLKKDDKLAFFMNAYNIYTIWQVADHLRKLGKIPKDFSVLQIKDFWKNPICHFLNLTISLDQIEKTILWETFLNCEIHFGLVCASKGCPCLFQVYLPDKVKAQLRESGQSFLKRSVIIDKDKKEIHLSQIFEWYGDQFPGTGNLTQRLLPWATEEQKPFFSDPDYKVVFSTYNWGLNYAY